MEIREIFETNLSSNNLEVKFRMNEDSDEVIRTHAFDIDEIVEYGYEIFKSTDDLDELDEDSSEEEYELNDWDIDIDESELTSFMNEYFSINENIPDAEIY